MTPDPDPPTPPTPTTVPCALLLHITRETEDDLGVSNGTVAYLPPGASDWITYSNVFSRAVNTYEPITFTFAVPEGSQLMVTCDLFDENGSRGSAELEGYFSGPHMTTLGDHNYVTGPSPYDTVVMPESEIVEVYGWLGYCSYQSV